MRSRDCIKFLAVGVLALAACRASAPRARIPPHADEANAEASGPGAAAQIAALASNARHAIALRDQVAALNDVYTALSLGAALASQAGSGPPSSSPAGRPGLDANGVNVQLLAAQTSLLDGRNADADAALQRAMNEAEPKLAPPTLALLKARAALDQAQSAVSSGRLQQTRTQLATTLDALRTYQASGSKRAGQASAMESALRNDLADPQKFGPNAAMQLAQASHEVGGWLAEQG